MTNGTRIQTGRNRGTLYATSTGETPRSLARDVGPVVYAARVADGVIKIGFTGDIYGRVRSLGGLSALLALRAGTYEDEQAIHAALKPYRHHAREYYHPTPEVLAVVNDMRSAMGFEPIAA